MNLIKPFSLLTFLITSSFAQTTMCYKQNHSDFSTIESINLDGGLCNGNKSLKDMKKDGLRFAYHTAPAPNTSTAGVVGTTAALLPIYKKYFIETPGVILSR